jgi:hypothetical protein
MDLTDKWSVERSSEHSIKHSNSIKIGKFFSNCRNRASSRKAQLHEVSLLDSELLISRPNKIIRV